MRNGTYSCGESSSSTSLSSQNDTEDDRMIAIVLSEEYAQLDGEVGTRLSNLAPVPVRSCLVLVLLLISHFENIDPYLFISNNLDTMEEKGMNLND